MQKTLWSHYSLSVFFGFLFALSLIIFSVFMDGYAQARGEGEESWPVIYAMVLNFSKIMYDRSPSFDMSSDDSFQRYLSNDTPFDDLNYVPSDLEPINSNFTANDARKFKLRKEAGDMFADMARHFRHEFSGDRLAIFSAYRSKSYQDSLLRAWCNKDACAKWGTSEHQAWLALDLRVVTKWGRSLSMDTPNKYTDWLHEHAQERGFHNTYQKGVAIDGKIIEGRHRRYLWIDLATLLQEKWETIAEYYSWMNKN